MDHEYLRTWLLCQGGKITGDDPVEWRKQIGEQAAELYMNRLENLKVLLDAGPTTE